MLTHTQKQFSILFFIIVLIELLTVSTASLQYAHYIAKPAIVASLIVLVINTSSHLPKTIKNLTITALIFALLGDVLLMFAELSPHFFSAGLVAFLLAHLYYVLVFFKHRNGDRSPLVFIVILLIYALVLFYFLKDGLGVMLFPVIIYMSIILTMATAAYLRKNKVNSMSYRLVFTGAIFFMISDSILALNRFYESIPWSNISIMITYAIAQYLIVLGILKISVTNSVV